MNKRRLYSQVAVKVKMSRDAFKKQCARRISSVSSYIRTDSGATRRDFLRVILPAIRFQGIQSFVSLDVCPVTEYLMAKM